MKYFHLGKRSIIMQDYYQAVQELEQACQLFDALYGVGAKECADVYLSYAISLIESTRDDLINVESKFVALLFYDLFTFFIL